MGNYTPRPPVTQAVRWTGDNLAEFEAWAATFTHYTWTFAELADGLQITINPSGGGSTLIPLGQWAVDYGHGYNVSPMPDADFQAQYQALPGVEPRSYDITGS